MRLTMDTDCDLARQIRDGRVRNGDFTVQVFAHKQNPVSAETLVSARLVAWTVHKACDHSPSTMDTEWEPTANTPQLLAWPEPAI
jgi:hypothetical protein